MDHLIVSGTQYIEIAKLHRYSPGGALYRIPQENRIKFNVEEFTLFAFHSQHKLLNLEWQRIGARMHIASDYFVRSSTIKQGVEITKFFLNKANTPCPGVPKFFLNVDQWGRLMEGLMQVHTFLFKDAPISPCFYNADHYDQEDFHGCPVCLCFTGKPGSASENGEN